MKQSFSAKNNQFLADIKKVFNSKIYAKARRIYMKKGEEETVKYINRFGDFKEVLKIIEGIENNARKKS